MAKKTIPIWKKSALTVQEASAYSNIGEHKIRELTDADNCPFVLWVGRKRLIKRVQFDEYLKQLYSI